MALPADASFLDQLLGPPHVQTSTATTATTYEPRALWQLLGFTVEDDPDANTLRIYGPGGTGAAPANITWQPGGTASGTTYTDWASACAACVAVSGPVTFWWDASFGSVAPPSGTWNFGTQTTVRGKVPADSTTQQLQWFPVNGCHFTNSPIAWVNLDLVGALNSALITTIPAAFTCEFYNSTFYNISGSAPVYDISTNTSMLCILHDGTRVRANGSAATLRGTSVQFTVLMFGDSWIEASTFSGFSIEVIIRSDTCNPNLTQTASPGTVTVRNQMLDPRGLLSSGATGARPVSTGFGSYLLAVGARYFDTTLGKPIWWNGSAWVDATGAAV